MDKQRLMELAGISSNMNNPSQEPYQDIPPSVDSPTGSSAGTKGYDQLGDDGEMDLMDKIKEIAGRGAEKGHEECQEILDLLGDEEEHDGEEHEELEPDSSVPHVY